MVSYNLTPSFFAFVLWLRFFCRGVRQIESKCSSETVVSAEFHPVEDGVIITCGKVGMGSMSIFSDLIGHFFPILCSHWSISRHLAHLCLKGHVNFWQIDPSYSSLSRKTGVLDPRDKPKYFTSLAFSCTGDVITGDSNGNMLIWARGYNAVTKVTSIQ